MSIASHPCSYVGAPRSNPACGAPSGFIALYTIWSGGVPSADNPYGLGSYKTSKYYVCEEHKASFINDAKMMDYSRLFFFRSEEEALVHEVMES